MSLPRTGSGSAFESVPILKTGYLSYQVPAQMRERVRGLVEVRVDRQNTGRLIENMAGSGTPQVRPVKVASDMIVRLDGGDDFKIPDLGAASRQRLLPDAPARWVFSVTPLRSGELLLVIRLFAVLDENAEQLVETHTETVRVHVNTAYTVTSFASRNWKELVGVNGLIWIGLGWLIRRRRTQTSTPEPKPKRRAARPRRRRVPANADVRLRAREGGQSPPSGEGSDADE